MINNEEKIMKEVVQYLNVKMLDNYLEDYLSYRESANNSKVTISNQIIIINQLLR